MILTPRACRQPSVALQSCAVEKFSSRDSPSANAAIIAARCEIDLSPGKRSSPTSRLVGETTMWADAVALSEGSNTDVNRKRSSAMGSRLKAKSDAEFIVDGLLTVKDFSESS